MPIYQLLQKQAGLRLKKVAVLGKIFEEILVAMGWADRKD